MINSKLDKNAKKIDNFLINFLKKQKKSFLVAPMKYGVISGGKKIRSTIILNTSKILKETKILFLVSLKMNQLYFILQIYLKVIKSNLIRYQKTL